MSADGEKSCDAQFLICAPTGRDGELTKTLLERIGVDARVCADVVELCVRADRDGCAGVMIAEEVLVPRALAALRRVLARQESWSDLPILLFTARSSRLDTASLLSLGNVTLLERPLRPITMRSAALSALRARERQYTARAELMEQQRAVRQRDQFLAMLGHELRNPLAAIVMAVKLEEIETASPYHAIVARQASHLSRLVDDLLDVSRVTSGKISLRRQPVDVIALVRRAVEAIKPTTDGHELHLDVRAQAAFTQGDGVRLEQVVNNLLTNAVKYTPCGGRIDVRLELRDDDIVVSVQDTGVGIAEDMLPTVFEPFTQVERTLDRAQGGMGIGLTLVRNLVELHHGRVEAESEGLGKGSTFRVILPVCPTDALPSERPSAELRRKPAARHVLVVEDNADSRELLRIGLTRRGHQVSASANGLTGVEAALEQRPSAMLVDIGLPGLDGYGVARRVRSVLGRSVYLVALTGYGQPEDRARALRAGFDVHLTKPVDLARLDELLAEHAAPS